MITAYENHSKNDIIELLSQKDLTIVQLKAELAQIKKLIYGSKSERFIPTANPEQLTLDLDIPSDKAEDATTTQNISYIRKQSKKNNVVSSGRMPLGADLPRVEIIIEPKEDVTGLKKIGE